MLISGEETQVKIEVQSELIVRQSTARLKVLEPRERQALKEKKRF
jgi:hypothetical protein